MQAWAGPYPTPTFSSGFHSGLSAQNGFTTAELASLPNGGWTADGRYIPSVLSNQQLAFGIDRRRDLTDPQALEQRVNKVFSDSFGPGASRFIEELLIINILTSQQRLLDWCPIVRNPHGNHIRWRRTVFHHAMADPIPEQGVARVVTQSYEEWENYSARVGLAFQMEDGFRMTAQGQRDYVCHLAQLTNGFVTYGLLDIIMSLVSQAKPWLDEVMSYGGKYTDNEWRQRLDQETAIHGVMSKSTDPGNQIKYYIDMIGDNRNRTFTASINSSGTRRLFDAKDKYHQDYSVHGPRAYQYQDHQRNEMDKVPLKEYETSRYPIGNDGRWSDPLKHPCVTVAYHQLRPVDYSSPENYRTANDCMLLLDHKTDSLFKLGIHAMLRNCGLFDANGMLRDGNLPGSPQHFLTSEVPGRPMITGGIHNFGDYLKYHGLYRALCEATNLALARARKACDDNALVDFQRRFAAHNVAPGLFPNQARHRGRPKSAKERGIAAKAAIKEIADGFTPLHTAYQTLYNRLDRFKDPLATNQDLDNAFQDFRGNYAAIDPCVLDFFEAACEMVAPRKRPGEFNALFTARNRLANAQQPNPAPAGGNLTEVRGAVYSEREIGFMFDSLPISKLTRGHFEWFADNDVQIPLRFMAIRYCYDIMAMMIVGIPGSSTGNLCLGDGNFQLSHNGTQKMLYGYAHIWIGCVINDRENIALLPNVRAVAYLRGGSKEIWDPLQDAESYRRGNVGNVFKDIFCAPLLPSEILEDTFDLTGRNPPNITEAKDFRYAACDMMQTTWGWIVPNSPYVDRDVFSPQRMPTRVFRGYTCYPDPEKGSTSVGLVQYGKGHWPVTPPGSVATRNGCGDSLLIEKPKGLIELADVVSYDYPVGA